MVRRILSDEMWEQFEVALRAVKDSRGAPGKSEREFLETVLFLARTGTPWRDLPAEFGKWSAVYMRFRPIRLDSLGSEEPKTISSMRSNFCD